MEKIIFNYQGQPIPIVCNRNEIFKDIVKRFKTKIGTNKNNLYFVKDAREVPEGITYEMLCNSFDRENKTIKVLVFEKEIDINENMNNSYNNFSATNKIFKSNYSFNSNNNMNSVLSKMQSDINQLKEELKLYKFLKNDIQGIRFELIDLKQTAYKADILNEQLEKSKKENELLLQEIKENTIKNNVLLKEIKKNIELNNKLKKEIEENKTMKTNLRKYVDDLFEQQNQALKNSITVKNSEKLQNCFIGNSPNNIVRVQYDGKISSNIIFTRGMIIAWSGNLNKIPKGWALCDGTNQTPDLRSRFILGASEQFPFGTYGGNNSIKLEKTNLPPIGEALFSADSHWGSFHHSDNGFLRYLGWYSVYVKNGKDDDWGSNWKIDLNTGLNATPIDIMNPFIALFFIMKL